MHSCCSALLLSLSAWLHPATREEVHSGSKRRRGGPGVSPPGVAQGRDLLVEGGGVADGRWEVGACLHRWSRFRRVCAAAQRALAAFVGKCSTQTGGFFSQTIEIDVSFSWKIAPCPVLGVSIWTRWSAQRGLPPKWTVPTLSQLFRTLRAMKVEQESGWMLLA